MIEPIQLTKQGMQHYKKGEKGQKQKARKMGIKTKELIPFIIRFVTMKQYCRILFALLLCGAAMAQLGCPRDQRATKSNLHYPGWTGLDCPAATIDAQSNLASYHYRKACQDAFDMPTLPPIVAQVDVVDCFEAPAPGWSDGTVVAVEICCHFDCQPASWTPWLDRDNPGGLGDYEDLATFLTMGQACPQPCGIQCRRRDGGQVEENTVCSTNYGFRCVNNQQKDGRCQDYQVRFMCPRCYSNPWTPWYDRDNASGDGDYEDLVNLVNQGKGCKNPCEIECQTLSGVDHVAAGEKVVCNTDVGFKCTNKSQPDGQCQDYKVRMKCP